MATITEIISITKQYAFCDEIKKNILSFIPKPKPMKSIGEWLLSYEFQEIFNQHHRVINTKLMTWDKADVKLIYRLRMLVSLEQFQFERTELAHNAMEKYKNKLRAQGVVSAFSMYGWFMSDGLSMWLYVLKCCDDGNLWSGHRGTKITHLKQIQNAGEKSSKHQKKLQQIKIKNEKRREIVSCECCHKLMCRSSLSRHSKKCVS